ncbi:MAG: WPE palindromic element domain-containing protein [Wolbachia sp.]
MQYCWRSLDTGIQQNLLQTKQHFQSKNWIPVSATLMTSLGTAVIKEPVPATLMTELLR